MVGFKFMLRVMALLGMSLWAQSASALSCPFVPGAPGINTAAELFANAGEDTCGGAAFGVGPTKYGHVLFADNGVVGVQFIYNGLAYTPGSKSLACVGSTSVSASTSSILALFPAGSAFGTVCTLDYLDINGQAVTHIFGAGAQFVTGSVLAGFLNQSEVTTGWFERISPTVVFSGVSGALPNGAIAVTATFSENVASFSPADLSLVNATVASIAVLSGSTFEFDLVPAGTGTFSVQLPANAITDLPGNGNVISNIISGTADFTSPTVAISGLPTEIFGPEIFAATITFSEPVTGFTAADITIAGGSATTLTGSGAVYSATVSATGGVDLSMSIAAGVAQDAAGNDNIASPTVVSANVAASATSAAVNQFLQTRANALLSSQPDLAGFLRGGGAGQFAAEVSREGGMVNFDSGYDAPIWARLNAGWSTNLGAESQYIFGVVGGHSKLSENFLIGGMVQFDISSEVNGLATTKGSGWLIGPYFAAKLASQPLYFEGSLLYGQTSNTISPLGTYSDAFTTERWLATLGVSGEVRRGNMVWLPYLDAKYTSDAQAAYIDGLGNSVAAQTIGLAQVVAGLDVELALNAATTLNGGVSGLWSYSSGSVMAPGYAGGRARVNFGVAHRFSDCNALALSGFYDGIGAVDFESYGAELKWQTCF